MRLAAPFALCAALTATGPAAAQAVMEPGGWEMRTRITAQDPATGQTRTVNESTMRLCLSAAFLAREPYLTPGLDRERMVRRGAQCTVADALRDGDTASWTMDCTMADGSQVETKIRNAAAKHELQSDLRQRIVQRGQAMAMHTAMTARHVGACTADMVPL